MNKRILWIVAVAVTAFTLSLNTVAQPGYGPGGPRPERGPGMGPGGGMGLGMGPGGGRMAGLDAGLGMGPGAMSGIGRILQNPEYIKMLELTEEQTSQLQTAMQETMQRAREEFTRDMMGQQGNAMRNPEVFMQRMEQTMDAVEARSREILNPGQQTKARETMFQLTGGLDSPFLNERALAVVNLSDEQKEQIRKIAAERNAEHFRVVRDMMEGRLDIRNMSPDEQERLRGEAEARNKRYADQMSALLTPEQRAQAERLTAEAPALRETLGIPTPGERRVGQRQPPPRGGGRQQSDYVPGTGAWRPGQGAGTPPREGQRRGNFPRQGEGQ